MPLVRLTGIRMVTGALTLLVVSAVVFFGTATLPGNAAKAALGREATPAAVAALSKEFHLNRPIVDRYGSWLWGLVHGRLGQSLPSGTSVASLVNGKISNTAALAVITLALIIPLSILLGVASAIRAHRRLDHVIIAATLPVLATPSFVVGSILIIVFSFALHLFPAVSLAAPGISIGSRIDILVLPVLTLLGATLAQTTRMIRAGMLDVLHSQYVEMARLKGVPEWRVLLRHALPNAIAPTIQIFALALPWLMGDVVVVEQVFGYQGLGTALVEAVSSRDLPTVEAIAMLIAATVITVNLFADVLVILLNPKLRRGMYA